MARRSKPSVWSKEARNSYSGQFAGRLIEMLESPAYRALSLAAHRVLSRIEVELGHMAASAARTVACLSPSINFTTTSFTDTRSPRRSENWRRLGLSKLRDAATTAV